MVNIVVSKKFLKANRHFWHKIKEKDVNKLLLVETQDHPVVNHSNAVTAKMIAQARNWRIAWLTYDHTQQELMKSYSPNSIFIKIPKLSLLAKLPFLFLAIYYYLYYVVLKNQLLSFKFRQIPYGDFVYDIYLSEFSLGTLHRFDPRLIIIFLKVLLNDQRARIILQNKNIKGILVSHYIGLRHGPLSRVALSKKIPVYWKGGGHQIFNLSLFKNLSQIYNFPLKPSKKIIHLLSTKYAKKIRLDFKDFIDQPNNPFLALNYNSNNQISKKDFLKKYKLTNKPLVFVMLHAFNDHPQSFFRKMIFKDYYDWFVQTLSFAKKDKSKNWIFKEHPANKYYPTNDLNLDSLVSNLPPNVKFLSGRQKINATVVLNTADAVITCLGSPGVEMPAFKKIPAIIAGESSYSGLGFTIEPQSKKEYFSILKRSKLRKISLGKQLKAKACYLYLREYCMVPFAVGPAITFPESKKPKSLKKTYSQRVIQQYQKNSACIYNQFQDYVKAIKEKNFSTLNKLTT